MPGPKNRIFDIKNGKVVDEQGHAQSMAIIGGGKPHDPIQPNAFEVLERWSRERQEQDPVDESA